MKGSQEKPLKVSVRHHLLDLIAFRRLVPKRQKRIAKATGIPVPTDPVRQLSQQLHPSEQHLVITQVCDEGKTARTFWLAADRAAGTQTLAYFRAGQYLNVRVPVNDVTATRPYSISSAPCQSLGDDGFYELTIKQVPDGFLTEHIWQNWGEGTKLNSSGPQGLFYFEPMRDQPQVVGLAGGSGITPFRAMAKEIVHGDLDAKLTIIYGSSDQEDILFYDELKVLEANSERKIRIVHVLSCDEVTLDDCEQGFLTAEIIQKHADVEASSFFICGPQEMYRFVKGELTKLNLPRKRVRYEVFGQVKDVTQLPDYPAGLAEETFTLAVHMAGETHELSAKASESVLVALERGGLLPPSRCRSGECGWCRTLLLDGEVYVNPDGDGRRAADKLYSYIHPCSTWPLSDLQIEVSRSV